MMRKSRFTEEQIIHALRQVDAGVPVAELCRKYGISQNTYYRWRKQYGGLEAGELRRLKDLEGENARLKRLVADLTLDKQVLQDVLRKKD
jgi:putative transposase